MTLPTLPLVDPNQLAATGNLASLKRAAAEIAAGGGMIWSWAP